MDIHIRTKIRYEYSHIEAAVIRIGEETFEIGGWGDYILNGIQGAQMPNMISDYSIVHESVNEKVHKYSIMVSEDQRIVLKNFKDMVSISIVGPRGEDYEESFGLLGDHQGRMVARDGQTIIEDFNEFGQEWQVLSSEPMLFEAVRLPQHPTQCRLPEPKSESRRRLGQSIAEETARKACAGWGDAIDNCIFDVMATGDLELAEAGAY